MSHFTVLVIGDNPEKQLAPYHQFECTGTNDEYVQEVDETDEFRKNYETGKVNKYRDKNGKYHCPYDDKFYREPTEQEIKKHSPMSGSGFCDGISYSSRDWNDGKGYRAKVHYLPEGFTEVEVPYTELMSFAEYVVEEGRSLVTFGMKPELNGDHKYGYALVDKKGNVTKVVDRTNPNYKWDWYSLGGRWTGFFKLKEGKNGKLGRRGVFNEEPKAGWVDTARIKDIDFKGMKDEAAKEALGRYENVERLLGGSIPKMTYSWSEIIDDNSRFKELTIDEKRTLYHGQPAKKTVEEARNQPGLTKEDRDFLSWLSLEDYQVSKEQYVENARNKALSTFAVLKDGKWYERGEMGWWACVSNEKDQEQWNREFMKLIQDLPEDTLVSVYDCHI